MRYRIVFLSGVHNFRHRLVGHKLECGKRDSHGKGGWVGDVEGCEALILEHAFGAGEDRGIC